MEESLSVLLAKANGGDLAARDQAFSRVQQELRCVAQRMLSSYGPTRSGLQATEVVSLACVKLLESQALTAESRTHFFFLLTRAMGDVLRDEEDRARALKRGGDRRRVPLPEFAVDDQITRASASELLAALDALRREDPDGARVAELRYLGGRSLDQTAELLAISVATVREHWKYARAWLLERLGPN